MSGGINDGVLKAENATAHLLSAVRFNSTPRRLLTETAWMAMLTCAQKGRSEKRGASIEDKTEIIY